MICTKATKEELRELFEIESIVFQGDAFAISLASMRYHLKNNRIFVAKEKGVIAGYILWLERKKYFRLYSIAVLPEFRGMGCGEKLLSFSFEELKGKAFSLEVKTQNRNAMKLYEKFGFEIKKSIKGYYPEGSDAYVMHKK